MTKNCNTALACCKWLMVDATVRLRKNIANVRQVRTTHFQPPDVGLHLLVFLPSDKAGAAESTYFGEYLGHGLSKTAFLLSAKGEKFDGKVLKVAR